MRKLLLTGTSLLALVAAGGPALACVTGDNASFGVTGSVDCYTVPTSGYYEITAAGAQGGGRDGGDSVTLQGPVKLTAGQQLDIIVGSRGGSGSFDAASGGGGGSFVFGDSSKFPILVAGGGGGDGFSSTGVVSGVSAGTNFSATNGEGGVSPGQAGSPQSGSGGGNGGNTTNNSSSGGGGGGGIRSGGTSNGSASGDGGQQITIAGAAGGAGLSGGGAGGFGGGGGGGGDGGGGGGFTGGGGGGAGGTFSGGGGGGAGASAWYGYNNVKGSYTISQASNGGDGFTKISYLGSSLGAPTPGGTAVPEPASLALFGTGLAGLGLIRRRRRG